MAQAKAKLSRAPARRKLPAKDPVFAVIAAHEAARHRFAATFDADGETKATPRAGRKEDECWLSFLTTLPTTTEGVLASLRYAAARFNYGTVLTMTASSGNKDITKAGCEYAARMASTLQEITNRGLAEAA